MQEHIGSEVVVDVLHEILVRIVDIIALLVSAEENSLPVHVHIVVLVLVRRAMSRDSYDEIFVLGLTQEFLEPFTELSLALDN